MTAELGLVLALLAAAIAMFAIGNPRMDAVALLMLTLLPFTGVINMQEALAGFSDANIVLIAALFVIGEGLVRTGVAQGLGDWLIRKAGNSEVRLLVLLMGVVGAMGAVMSSTGVVAIFIPVALRIAQSTGMAPSRLMMPLSMAALISGMMTLVATAPNLVVNSELVRSGTEGFHFFSFTPFGVPILILGILYMLFARRWLASQQKSASGSARRPSLRAWIDTYKLADREYRLRVGAGSTLVGKTLAQLDLRHSSGVSILAIERKGRFAADFIAPAAKTELKAGDILLVDLFAPKLDIEALRQRFALEALPLSGDYFADRSQDIGMVEVMVSADSGLAGKSVVEARFRTHNDLTVIGLRHGADAQEHGLMDEPMNVGDTLLLIGSWKAIDKLRLNAGDLLVLNLPAERDEILAVSGKSMHALFSLILMIVLMVSGIVPNVQAALIACLLMGAMRCVDLDSAYRSIHWKSLVLIVGMLPFSLALQRTGGVELAAEALMSVIGGAGTHAVLASLFVVTALLGLFISNTATAVLMAPVALAIANELQASPYPFAMIVALAASAAFMTPISSPVNTLVVGPGNYVFGDFFKVGLPFTVIVMIVSVVLVPVLLPLR
ncbi:SLC13 family permease [Variovorax sp. J22R115]|uniref:SLC13 family permease n=1 Tax=Variovorax sp. J22R115 TaxID=3053509 RepID=UPI002578F58C|nr:SLC13 family permease [Variovorax sp. J22R115]MDM0053896.1 SLC13 family permease [Variovorax sp. J22R115]